ncbi:MAG: MFS transporter [Cyanobacteria bacterium P01_F01_bin.143]
MLLKKILHLFPELKQEIWMICVGRLFSQIGHGLLIFSATIFWVNLIELSPTQIGIGLGLTSLAGIFGRLLGGTLIDSSSFDCRLILLTSTMISAIADFLFAFNQNFAFFLIGSFLMGLGIGMSWLAISAIITTIVTNEQYNEAFAVTRLSERIGVNGGIFLGGFAIAKMGANNIETYQKLYLLDGLTFLTYSSG